MVFASPAWGSKGIAAYLSSLKAPEPGPSGGSELIQPQCSCGWMLRWVWALGTCQSTLSLLPSYAELLHSFCTMKAY